MRVLVVDDEVLLADTISRGLRREGLVVDTAYDGDTASLQIAVNAYDVVVLDRDLPGIHGDELCATISREHPDVKVIMLTASGSLDDRVSGLHLGADDYLAKPFAFAELLAGVRAGARALGRWARPATPKVLSRNGLSLNPARRELTRDGHWIALSRRELGVLEELLRPDGAVVSAETLLEKVWDENADSVLQGCPRQDGDAPQEAR